MCLKRYLVRNLFLMLKRDLVLLLVKLARLKSIFQGFGRIG